MNFGEKLSVKKVYANAIKYVATHHKGFLFLTIFYYLESLIPSINIYLRLFCIYLLLYFAAGLYYKQQILTDTNTFLHASLRFLTAIVLFLVSMLLSSFCINQILEFIRDSFVNGEMFIDKIVGCDAWLVGKYVFIFFLLIIFLLIPSFAFISEISGKSRSVINAYVKTKGNLHKIALVVVFAVMLTWLTMAIFAYVNPYIAQVAYTMALVFGTIVYFKMYDFFYNIPQNKWNVKVKEKIDETKANTHSDNTSSKEEKKDVD